MIPFEIKHQKLKDGRVKLEFYHNGKFLTSIAVFMAPEMLRRYNSYITKYLSHLYFPVFNTIKLWYKKELVAIEMGLNVSGRDMFTKPQMYLILTHYNQKKNIIKTEKIDGARQELLKTLYDTFLAVEPTVKDEELESLLGTNLFKYYEITEDLALPDEKESDIHQNNFELIPRHVKVLPDFTAFVTFDDGCGNNIVAVDRNFANHKKKYRPGRKTILKLTPIILDIKTENILSDDSSWSEFKETEDFDTYPSYSFKAVTNDIETDGHYDYGFRMNMIHVDNPFMKQERLVNAVIENPPEAQLKDMTLASGICYFEISPPYPYYPSRPFTLGMFEHKIFSNEKVYSFNRPCTDQEFHKVVETIKNLSTEYWSFLVVDFRNIMDKMRFIQVTRHDTGGKYMVEISYLDDDLPYRVYRKYFNEKETIDIFKKVCLLGKSCDMIDWKDITLSIL